VKFQSTARDAIILPATAILQNEEQPSVFVVQKEGVYECRPVSVATTEEGKIWVTQGLKPGEIVVVNGGIFLNK
jgi:cobalt-zinc-cadmium efflux system membrane fusion protein